MIANQECSRLEPRSVMKILLVEKCKPYEIYTTMLCVLGSRFLVLRKKKFTNGLNICLPLQAKVKKRLHGVETHQLP